MKEEKLYLICFVLIAGILILCLCRYNNIKREQYYNSDSNNNHNENCNKKNFDRKILNLYKNMDKYQELHKKKMETLHKYEDLSEELEEVTQSLIKAEDRVKECLPNFS